MDNANVLSETKELLIEDHKILGGINDTVIAGVSEIEYKSNISKKTFSISLIND